MGLSPAGGIATLPPFFPPLRFPSVAQLRPMTRSFSILMFGFSLLLMAGAGCRSLLLDENATRIAPEYELENPLIVSFVDREWIMDAVSDELDNYFRIYREERIRLVDNILTEGWIETHPQIGATALEPWRRDSMPGFERTYATLQTIRRFAKVRVIPNGESYLLDIKVYKELEDLPEPEHSTISSRVLRHDSTVDIDNEEQPIIQPNRGWIPMGRDFSLEQHMLRNIRGAIEKHCRKQ
jgi:hypothetical protein